PPAENGVLYSLAALLEASDDAIIGKTLDNIILSWNRGAERIYGYTAQEAIGRSIIHLILPPERAAEPEEIIARVVQGERIEHFETERVTKDGRRVVIDLIATPIRDENGQITGALVIARDITEYKKAQ